MSILKSFIKILASLLFTTFLNLAILMMGLVEFTSYSNLKPFVTELLSDSLSQQVDKNQINELHTTLKQSCTNEEFTSFDLGGTSIKIKCSAVESLQPEKILNTLVSNFFDSIYYKKYSCELLECLKQPGVENLLVLVSAHANNFLRNIQSALWVLTAVGALMMYFSIDTLKGRLRIFGTNLAFSGASFLVLNHAIKFLIPSQILSLNIDIHGVVNKLFAPITNYFIIMLISGIVLIISSYLIAPKAQTKERRK